MEQSYEEPSKESARGGAWAVGRIVTKRGQAARQPRKWPQGRAGQKLQETPCPPPQRVAAARSRQESIQTVIAAIRARFGPQTIALGNAGIRYARVPRVSGG